MATLRATQTPTVDEFIEASESMSITYNSLCMSNLLKDEDISITIFNVIDDYIDEILEYANPVALSREDYDKYSQAPKLLSYRMYGTTEFDFIIMRINGIYDPKDFTMRKLKLLNKVDLTTILSQIYNANKKLIDVYNENHNE